MAFPDSTSQLGDSMNFPESPSIKKREALSNIIFKITQSTDKQNLRNERLLKLNLDYELRMLQLDQSRVKKISTKLNSEKVYHAKSSKWLFGNDYGDLEESSEKVNKFRRRHSMNETVNDYDFERMGAKEGWGKESKVKSQDESMKLPALTPLSNTALDTKNVFELIRSKTAPEMKYRSKKTTTENYEKFTSAPQVKEEIRDGTKAEIIDSESHSVNGLLQGSHGTKAKDKQHEDGNLNRKFLPEIDKDLSHSVSLKKRDSGSNLSKDMANEFGIQNSNIERELRRTEPKQSEKMKRLSFETQASNLEAEETNFQRLMNKAKYSTINSSAFEPVDPSYRRSCATRKRYEELEKQRPRILTRYFREKRNFERSTKSDQERSSNKLHSHFGF